MEVEPSSEARLRHQLDVQTKQINRVLSHHRVPATVSGGVVRPKVVRFDLQTQFASGLERIRELRNDLMFALGVGNVAISSEQGRWQLRVSQQEDAPVPLLKLMTAVPALPRQTAAIGMGDGGQPVLLRFSANQTSHVLITGDAGAGKTSLLRAIAAGLALANRQSDLQLQVMDPLWTEVSQLTGNTSPLHPLAYLPHMLTDPAMGIESCSAIFHFLAEEMVYRRRERVQSPRIIVLLDHALRYLEEGDDNSIKDFIQLLQYGAQAGIHLIMATDILTTPQFASTIMASVSVRIIGRMSDDVAARRIAGLALDKAPLRYGEGDFLAITGDEVVYFQAAYINDYDLHMKLYEMVQSSRPRLLAHPYSSRPRVKKDDASHPKTRNFTMRGETIDLVEDEGKNVG